MRASRIGEDQVRASLQCEMSAQSMSALGHKRTHALQHVHIPLPSKIAKPSRFTENQSSAVNLAQSLGVCCVELLERAEPIAANFAGGSRPFGRKYQAGDPGPTDADRNGQELISMRAARFFLRPMQRS